MQNNNKKLIMVSIIAFVIGFLVAWLIWGNVDSSLPADGGETNGTEVSEESTSGENALNPSDLNSSQASGESSLTVSDQAPGRTVVIDSANLDGAAWVAVREVIDGEPGNILGARFLVESGNDVEVELLRGTVEGGSYSALLFLDDGDMIFNHEADVALTETQANFMTSVVPEE